MAARAHCLANGLALHDCVPHLLPEYVKAIRRATARTYAWLWRFHRPSAAVLTATPTIRRLLQANGFASVADRSRGVDLSLFPPAPGALHAVPAPRVPVSSAAVAVEKDLPPSCGLDLPAPRSSWATARLRAQLERRFLRAVFAGAKSGAGARELSLPARRRVRLPSRTDTFGLVLLEAMAFAARPWRPSGTRPRRRRDRPSAGVLGDDCAEAAFAAPFAGPRRRARPCRALLLWRGAPGSSPSHLSSRGRRTSRCSRGKRRMDIPPRAEARAAPAESPVQGQDRHRAHREGIPQFAGRTGDAWRHESAFRQEVSRPPSWCRRRSSCPPAARAVPCLVGSVPLVLVVELLNSSVEAAIDRISSTGTRSRSAPGTWAARPCWSRSCSLAAVWALVLLPRAAA